jgi:hypothetical protein
MKLLNDEVIEGITSGIKEGIKQSGLELTDSEEKLVETSVRATIDTIEKIIELQN